MVEGAWEKRELLLPLRLGVLGDLEVLGAALRKLKAIWGGNVACVGYLRG